MDQDFFALASARLGYLGARQTILARNIANANTPGYEARDVPDFASLLEGRRLSPTTTNARHLLPAALASAGAPVAAPERSPDGNTVDIERQLTGIAGNETNLAAVGNLWKSYMGMYMAALGRGG